MSHPEIDLAQLQKMAQVNRQVIHRLKERVSILETALGLVCDDPQMAWLYRNRSERMDATLPLFPKARADFHLARYQFAAQHVADKSVADIACGTGYGVSYLREFGKASQIVGIDCCPQAIEYARNKHQPAGCRFETADALQTGLPDAAFNVVTSFETIEHVEDEQGLLDEFARILQPGGTLICSTPNGWPLAIAPHHVRVYDRQSFLSALESRFEVLELFNQNSGSDFKYNRGQAQGIIPTCDENQELAECFIAVARRK
ncbi:MAG: class I SAM-dependent methyltransferase [Pirellulaceae bacterium]|nr:class I SAM-dependent methyltransferase [Pirellulaceae bacterium]